MGGTDKLIWHYELSGIYSVKSGYRLAWDNEVEGSLQNSSRMNLCLRGLWNLSVPAKVKIHIWRAIFDALPVNIALNVRLPRYDVYCPRCGKYYEDVIHALWYCKFAKAVWKLSAIWPLLVQFRGGKFLELFGWVVEHGGREDVGTFAVVCWSIWLDRNQIIFTLKRNLAQEVLERASNFLDSFQISGTPRAGPRWMIGSSFFWRPPESGFIKINVDASVKDSYPFCGVGVVGWDEHGVVLFGLVKCISGLFTPHFAELLAVYYGILAASQFSHTPWLIETDATSAVQSINRVESFSDDAFLATIISNAISQQTRSSVQHCRREGNRVAHCLATKGLHQNTSFEFSDFVPLFLRNSVCWDLMHC